MSEVKVSQGRGPGYPTLALGKAIERVEQVYKAGVRDRAFAPQTFYSTWGLGAKSSGSRQTMAALNHYGLVLYEGLGKERKVALSAVALSIVQDKRPNSADRETALKIVALTPSIHARLYEQFPPPMPEDVFIEHVLVSEYGYSESSAQSVIKVYKKSLSFAKLDNPDSLPVSDNAKADKIEDDLDSETINIEVGDLIQGTVGDLDVFPKGATVLGFSDDKNWIYHDFSDSPLEVKDATIMQKAQVVDKTPPPMPDHLRATLQSRNAVNDTLPAGSFVLSSGKVKDVSFEVRVTGDVNKTVIDRIIAYLELAKGDYDE